MSQGTVQLFRLMRRPERVVQAGIRGQIKALDESLLKLPDRDKLSPRGSLVWLLFCGERSIFMKPALSLRHPMGLTGP